MGQGLQRDFTWFPLGVGGSTWFWSHKTPFERRAFRRIAWTFWVYGLVAFRTSPATIWSKGLFRACFLSRNTWNEKPTEIAEAPTVFKKSYANWDEGYRVFHWMPRISTTSPWGVQSSVESWKSSFFPIPKISNSNQCKPGFQGMSWYRAKETSKTKRLIIGGTIILG